MYSTNINLFKTRESVLPVTGELYLDQHTANEFSSLTSFFDDEEKLFNSIAYSNSDLTTEQSYHLSFYRSSTQRLVCNFSNRYQSGNVNLVINDDDHFKKLYFLVHLANELFRFAATRPAIKDKYAKQIEAMLGAFKSLCIELEKSFMSQDKTALKAAVVDCANRFPHILEKEVNSFLNETLSKEDRALIVDGVKLSDSSMRP